MKLERLVKHLCDQLNIPHEELQQFNVDEFFREKALT